MATWPRALPALLSWWALVEHILDVYNGFRTGGHVMSASGATPTEIERATTGEESGVHPGKRQA